MRDVRKKSATTFFSVRWILVSSMLIMLIMMIIVSHQIFFDLFPLVTRRREIDLS